MERLFSNIIGTPVVDDDFKHPITTVRDVVVDPERGKVIALIVDVNRNLVIAPIDILAWGDTIRIPSHDAIIEGSDILRVAEVQKRNIKIFHNKVVTMKNEYIGKVVDFSIDIHDLSLKKLYTAKDILGLLRYDSRIITSKIIERILPRKIIIKMNIVNLPEERRGVAEEAMAG